MAKIKEDTRPLGSPKSWASTYGTHLAGQAAIDGADHEAITQENKWGAGRLRLLVETELREKFDKQRFKLNSAIWHGDLAELQREAQRMVVAWRALDRAAEDAGASKTPTGVWEVTLEDGTVAVIQRNRGNCRTRDGDPQGRQVVFYTLEEIGTMLSHYREVVKVKEAFPGSKVEAIRRTIDDPLDGIRDGRRLEDTLDDPLPHFGN
jgi:hypothetical protein